MGLCGETSREARRSLRAQGAAESEDSSQAVIAVTRFAQRLQATAL